MITFSIIYVLLNLLLYCGVFFKLYEWAYPVAKSFIAHPFLVKEIVTFFYQEFISWIKSSLKDLAIKCIPSLWLLMCAMRWVEVSVSKILTVNVVVIKVLKFAFFPLWILKIVFLVVLSPFARLIIKTIEYTIGMPIIATADTQVSLIPRSFTRRFTDVAPAGSTSYFDRVYTWVRSLVQGGDMQAGSEESHANTVETNPSETNPVRPLYLAPNLGEDTEFVQNTIMTLLTWIEQQKLPRLENLADRDGDAISHWFQFQSPELLCRGVLTELFSVHRDTRLEKMLEFFATDTESRDLAIAIATLLLISFDIKMPLPVRLIVGHQVPNVPRRPFERFVENMADTLQSSRSTLMCDFMLANLTDSTIAAEIVNKQWTDKNSTSNKKKPVPAFITEFIEQPFIVSDPKPSKFRFLKRALFWFKRTFTKAGLAQDAELKFLRLYADKTLKDLHELQELFWFQPGQHPRLIATPSSSLRASSMDTEDYEVEHYNLVHEILEDVPSTPTEIPDIPPERQVNHNELRDLIDAGPDVDIRRLDRSYYAQRLLRAGQRLTHPKYDSNDMTVKGEVIGSPFSSLRNINLSGTYTPEINNERPPIQYQQYPARLIEPAAGCTWEWESEIALYGSNHGSEEGERGSDGEDNERRSGSEKNESGSDKENNSQGNLAMIEAEETDIPARTIRLRSFSWPMVSSGSQILPRTNRQPSEDIVPGMSDDAILMAILRDDDDEYVNDPNNPITSDLIASMYHRNSYVSTYAQSIIYGSFEADFHRSCSSAGSEYFDNNGFPIDKDGIFREKLDDYISERYNNLATITEADDDQITQEGGEQLSEQEQENLTELITNDNSENDNNNALDPGSNSNDHSSMDGLLGTENIERIQDITFDFPSLTEGNLSGPTSQNLNPGVQNILDDLSDDNVDEELAQSTIVTPLEQTQDIALTPPVLGVQNILDDLTDDNVDEELVQSTIVNPPEQTQDIALTPPVLGVQNILDDLSDDNVDEELAQSTIVTPPEQTQDIALTPPTQTLVPGGQNVFDDLLVENNESLFLPLSHDDGNIPQVPEPSELICGVPQNVLNNLVDSNNTDQSQAVELTVAPENLNTSVEDTVQDAPGSGLVDSNIVPVNTGIEDAVQEALGSLLDLDNGEPGHEVIDDFFSTPADRNRNPTITIADMPRGLGRNRLGSGQLRPVTSEELEEIRLITNPPESDLPTAFQPEPFRDGGDIIDLLDPTDDNQDSNSDAPPTFEELRAIEAEDIQNNAAGQDISQGARDAPGPGSGSSGSNNSGSGVSSLHGSLGSSLGSTFDGSGGSNVGGINNNNDDAGSGSSFAEVFFTQRDRAEFEQHFASLSTAVYNDVQDLRKKMSTITRIMRRLMSGESAQFLNTLHASSVKGETLAETTEILQKLRQNFKSTADHFQYYEGYIEDFGMGYAFYRAVEFATDFIEELERTFEMLDGERRIHGTVMRRVKKEVAENTRMVKNLRAIVQQYIYSSVHLTDPQRRREFRESVGALLEYVSIHGDRYDFLSDIQRRRNLIIN
ncbi:uncharacterized protein EV154DRAFT_477907 [Mucor mucedo]|uniref:uncharacterized protein n=1 Tax=Mucor mucedo TaxID=29922 RepID=UPI00221F1A0B|nr:uncharacterized protein EV154DRAFT_477907 [Mucor mucedo]KAI7894805.1 hypothetical protein EV154DRAFT_477907 [Mucor mucedo]